MSEEFYRKSRLTNEYYNLFDKDVIRILNASQCAFYMEGGANLLDVYLSKGRDDKPILVFLFKKSETRELYDAWCKNHNLTKGDKNENSGN